MAEQLQFLAEHGYILIFAVVFLEQLGLPIPTMPFAIGAGALAAAGFMSLGGVILVVVAASLPGDLLWYELGRRQGVRVLRFLCRISLEPDSCVRRTQGFFEAGGAPALIVSKFVPGFSTAAPPLAGVGKMGRGRFLVYATASSLLWIAAFGGLGYALHDQLEWVARRGAQLGGWAFATAAALIGLYIAVRFVQRQRFLRALRVARITPEELRERQLRGEPVQVVDLRHRSDIEFDAERISGALHIPFEEIEQRSGEIAPENEIILYCT